MCYAECIMRLWKMQGRQGFTIVELAVVIVVIGILAGIVLVAYPGIQKRAADTEVQGDLRQASMRIEAHKANAGGYPLTQEEVDGGKGLPRSNASLTYDYTATVGTYCLSATSQKSGKKFSITNASSEIVEGDCPVTTVPSIAVVGSQSANTGGANSATLAVTKPAGTQEGNLLLLSATMVEGSRSTADFAALSGWTLMNSSAVTSPNRVRQSVWYKVAGSSEPSSYTVNAVAGSDCKMVATVTSFSSVDTGAPIMAFNSNTNASNSTTAAYGSVTATSNSYLVAIGGGRGSADFSASPTVTAPYAVTSSSKTTAASFMYTFMAAGQEVTIPGTVTPPSMTYGGTMTTNMTHSVLLKQKTTP